MNWVLIEMKGYGKKLICFCCLKLKLIFFYMGFGPMKTLVEFIVKLCFIWSFMLNIQGMNCFDKKKKKKKELMYQANGVLTLLEISVI